MQHSARVISLVRPGGCPSNGLCSGQKQSATWLVQRPDEILIGSGNKLTTLRKRKDQFGKEAYLDNGIIQKAIRAVKKKMPDLVVMADLCFCEYTSHGHCGVLKSTDKKYGDVDNDATLKLIQKATRAQAKAGVDFICPSGMMAPTRRRYNIPFHPLYRKHRRLRRPSMV